MNQLLRGALATVITCAIPVAAWSQGATSSRSLNVHGVAGGVYMLDSGTQGFNGGNVAVLAGTSGVVVVDTQSDDVGGQAVIDAVRKITAKPIRYVINTHCHGDHSGGNAALQRAGATLIAHVNVSKRIEANKCDRGVINDPSITFDSDLTLRMDAEVIHIMKLPTGHSDGDSIVYFKNANVVHTGDAFVLIGLPLDSKYAGGTILGLIEALQKLIEFVPGDAKVIPGHGPQGSMTDVRNALATLLSIKRVVAEEIVRGRKLDELQKEDVLKPIIGSLDAKEREYYLRKFFEGLQYSL